MFAILKKEIQHFFSTPVGYLVIGLFITLNGLFLWVFKGEFNIFDYGFADLSGFFYLAPWIFIFLIPAITMKSFSEEKKQGTLELLQTMPIHKWQLVLGKYLGALVLICIAVLPSVLYVYTVYQLGNPIGSIDLGAVLGAYVGLLGIAMCYTAMGIFASAITNNQIVAFMVAALLCFVAYYGFYSIVESSNLAIANWGIKPHFETMSRGIIDSRDMIYFISISGLFLFFTTQTLSQK